jgi:hypothetical protein
VFVMTISLEMFVFLHVKSCITIRSVSSLFKFFLKQTVLKKLNFVAVLWIGQFTVIYCCGITWRSFYELKDCKAMKQQWTQITFAL